MKMKVLSQVLIMLLFSACIAQAKPLAKLGDHPFYKPTLTSTNDLSVMLMKKDKEVLKGLELAGYPELAVPLKEQYNEMDVKEMEYAPGESFKWMLFKPYGKGRVKVVKDLTWGGEKSFKGYEFAIESEGKSYTFVVPLICGNLALKGVTQIVLPPEPVVEATEELPMETVAAVVPVSPIGFVADAGYLKMPDPADYVFGRAGIEYNIMPEFSVLGMVGGAAKTGGADGKSAFIIDVLAQYNWSRAFVGLGVGGWITSGDDDNPAENTQLDLIGNIGVRVFGEPETFNTSIFMEARAGFDELDEVKDYGRFGAGLRFSL